METVEERARPAADARHRATPRALWIPTALLLVATALIAQLVLDGPQPVAVWAPTATSAPTAIPAPTATLAATTTPLIDRLGIDIAARALPFRPPVCQTPAPGATCLTSPPPCSAEILEEPGRICRWLDWLPEASGGR